MTPTRLGALTALLAAAAAAGLLAAQAPIEMPMAAVPAAVEVRAASPPPLRLAERPGAQVAYLLPAWQVAPLALEEIALWNRMGKTPAKVGFTRTLPEAVAVRFDAVGVRAADAAAAPLGLAQRAADGGLVWGAEVRLEDAYRLRLRLSDVSLPAGTQMWVYAENGETVGPFGLELRDPEGNLWTPSVAGPTLRLEVRLPGGAVAGEGEPGFVLDRAGEIVNLGRSGSDGAAPAPRGGHCLVDAQCIGAAEFPILADWDLRRSIAHLQFQAGGFLWACSGGLLNNEAPLEPLLLTAHHCIDNAASAASLEAFFDDVTPFCNGPNPDLGTLPRSSGAELLATGAATDFTLLRLSGFPDGNRILAGWNAFPEAAAHGTELHRLSHPKSLPQHYSLNRVSMTFPSCGGAPRPQFLYSTFQPDHGMGGTFGGSSGSPVMNASGQVLGQLLGGCGFNPTDGCDYSNAEVDGALSETFPAIAGWLLTGPTDPCVAGPTTLCLHGSRFRVEIVWLHNNVLRDANVVEGVGTSQSGLFYFLNATNWEFLVKVLNSCGFNNRYWVFFAATTDVGFIMTVTDTQTGEVRHYFNPAGQPADAITDTQAFATCP